MQEKYSLEKSHEEADNMRDIIGKDKASTDEYEIAGQLIDEENEKTGRNNLEGQTEKNLQEIDAKEGEQLADRELADSDYMFEIILKNHFKDLPDEENIVARPENLENVKLLSITSSEKLKAANRVNAVVYLDDKFGKDLWVTVTINSAGEIEAQNKDLEVLKQCEIDLDYLKREILIAIDKYGLEFWCEKRITILPPDDSGNVREKGDGETKPISTDAGRTEFLRKQPDCYFGAHTDIYHNQNYKAYFFDKFAVLESDIVGDALFVVSFDISASELKNIDRKSTRNMIASDFEKEWGNITKAQLKEFSYLINDVDYMTHDGVRYIQGIRIDDDDKWITKIKNLLNKRNDLGEKRHVVFSGKGDREPRIRGRWQQEPKKEEAA